MINTIFPNITALTTIDFIFGTFLLNEQLISFIILAAKYHIHYCYWARKSPNIQNFRLKLHQYEYLERIKAIHLDKLNIHHIKWDKFTDIFGSMEM